MTPAAATATVDTRMISWAPVTLGLLLGLAFLSFWSDSGTVTGRLGTGDATVFEFVHTKWLAGCMVLLAWCALIAVGRIRIATQASFGWSEAAVVALAAYAFVSLAWSPDRLAGGNAAGYLALSLGLFFVARLTSSLDLLEVLQFSSVVVVVGAFILIVAGDREGLVAGFGNPNFAAEAIVAMAAGTLVFWNSGPSTVKWLTRAAFAVAIIHLVFIVNANLQYVAGVAVLVHGLVIAGRRLMAATVLGAFVLLAVVGSAVVFATGSTDQLSQNMRDRLQTWGNTSLMIADDPLAGHGLGSFLHKGSAYVDRYREAYPFLGEPAFENLARQTDSAENELLHLAAELGGVGVLLGLAIIALVYRRSFIGGAASVPAKLALPLTAILGTSLLSFPFQNAATAMMTAVWLGAVLGWLDNPPTAARWVRIGVVAIGLSVAVAVGISAIPLWRTSKMLSWAEAHDRAGAPTTAAAVVLDALDRSDRLPKLRLRAYTQTAVAGVDWWQERALGSADLDALFESAASAAPDNPLLLDLRLKQLLSTPGLQVDRMELEEILARLKRSTGETHANAHVLEAALAIQLGQLGRAARAVERGRGLVGTEPMRANDKTNLENLNALDAILARERPGP
jgi:O-antigen ligase